MCVCFATVLNNLLLSLDYTALHHFVGIGQRRVFRLRLLDSWLSQPLCLLRRLPRTRDQVDSSPPSYAAVRR